jgi:hypothetical protein
LSGDAADELRSERSDLRERESQLTTRIDTELQHLQTLKRRAEQVQKTLAR